MNWKISTDRPVYLQLIEQIEQAIVAGQYPAGEKLPSVRELATEAGVNPNTMLRALSELENKGLVATQRTAGKSITVDVEKIKLLQEKLATQQIVLFLQNMANLGYSRTQALALLEKMEESL